MSSILLIIKAAVIGALGSLPVGPIVIMAFQRSVNSGHKAGMACAMGAIVPDTIYAALVLFAFSFVNGFISRYSDQIELIGGAVIIAVGIGMMLRKGTKSKKRLSTSDVLSDSGKAILMGFSNPGSFLWILTAFAAMGFDSSTLSIMQSLIIVAGVCGGSFIYWYFLTLLASKGESRIKLDTLVKVNRVSGAVVVAFGLFLLVQGLIK